MKSQKKSGQPDKRFKTNQPFGEKGGAKYPPPHHNTTKSDIDTYICVGDIDRDIYIDNALDISIETDLLQILIFVLILIFICILKITQILIFIQILLLIWILISLLIVVFILILISSILIRIFSILLIFDSVIPIHTDIVI